MGRGYGEAWRNFNPASRTVKPAAAASSRRAKPCIVTIGGEIYEVAIAKALGLVGLRCGSLFEAQRVKELILEQRAGAISELTFQRTFPLSYPSPTGPIVLGDYIADAVYLRGGSLVVEDVKGRPGRTPLYLWKKKHFDAQYAPLTITEVNYEDRKR